MVTTGATEAIAATLLALCEPGDEVVMFEPSYDSYAACAAMAGAGVRLVRLHPPDWSFDPAELVAARIIMGVGTSCYLVAPLALYARRFSADRFAEIEAERKAATPGVPRIGRPFKATSRSRSRTPARAAGPLLEGETKMSPSEFGKESKPTWC